MYKEEDLEETVQAVKEDRMSIREASKTFNIPRTTIGDRMVERHGTKNGRQPELTEEEEKMIVAMVQVGH